MSHYNAMIGQPVTLPGYAEGANVADTVIEARNVICNQITALHLKCIGRGYEEGKNYGTRL